MKAIQLAVTGVYIDGAGNKIADCPPELSGVEDEDERQGLLETNTGFYNRKILQVS